jgi:4-diphosphocytidyl-2-C-methyl-D-erythritol kinase
MTAAGLHLAAPAKINLYLHIGPLRADRLHDLASLFVFAHDGDVIRVEAAKDLSLKVTGPYAPLLKDLPPEKNLVYRAAELLAREADVRAGAAITLEKHLPVAAGVGGGSADAAAALRALVKLWNVNISETALSRLAFRLGADVPACLARAPVNVSGAGERIEKGPVLPPLWIALVNPRVEMPTGPYIPCVRCGKSGAAPAETGGVPGGQLCASERSDGRDAQRSRSFRHRKGAGHQRRA